MGQIAHNVGITAKTLYEWKNKYSKICEALKKGKVPNLPNQSNL